ncbi:hypothetical protein E3P96_01364 [Wallemia ichthyophaga]|nr:hypothetical protein E3P96_01364 [Wallemia ichthyophaga]
MGVDRVLCPSSEGTMDTKFERVGMKFGTVSIAGKNYLTENATAHNPDFKAMGEGSPGIDMTNYFRRGTLENCNDDKAPYATINTCSKGSECSFDPPTESVISSLGLVPDHTLSGYSWSNVTAKRNMMVIGGTVLNLTPYLNRQMSPIPDDPVDQAIRKVLFKVDTSGGKDATKMFYNTKELKDAVPCLHERYKAGQIDHMSPGCFASKLFLYAALIIILGVVLARFIMACLFNWYLAKKFTEPPKNMSRSVVSPSVMPSGANISVNNRKGTAPWASDGAEPKSSKKAAKNAKYRSLVPNDPIISAARVGPELYTCCLITCYSEGHDSIATTVESISASDYSDQRKLIFIVADGMITGHGEKISTPDICVSMIEPDPRFGNPMPMAYLAVGGGKKQENRAMIYAGHYKSKNGHRTPTIVLVKCGTEDEAASASKPGNRGKRDSQIVLMNFFSRVTYNDRMTPLDYDLFRKTHTLMGVTPDYFETIFMIDADTKIFPDALTKLILCMQHDNLIMGVCGETRLENKRASWVTWIQVFEYYISHHMVKAFESVFGGVTCLPGCFSMYRIKARRDEEDDWVPLIVKPDIVEQYSQTDVQTLHQKNLLLLGEDRFLSTMMLRTFPNRKMMFCPSARCRTIAPDEFKVLLSQRRRWINSTVHNLMELVLVRNLCGTFCFSMQFVILMDLIGTVVLPIAILLSLALIINSIITPPTQFADAIPLMMLCAVLGLPAILILITNFKIVYIGWMVIYIIALPIWNLVLPVYSFWHFDDFSWGETRKVEGEAKSVAHDDKEELFTVNIPLRRWEDWERSRLRKTKREERTRKEYEKAFGQRAFYNDLNPPDSLHPDSTDYAESDNTSLSSYGEEDKWGEEIGNYNEFNSEHPPPASKLTPAHDLLMKGGGREYDADAMEELLNEGFDENRPQSVWFLPSRQSIAGNAIPAFVQEQERDARMSKFKSAIIDSGTETPDSSSYSVASPFTPSESFEPLAHTSAFESMNGEPGHMRQRSGGQTLGQNSSTAPRNINKTDRNMVHLLQLALFLMGTTVALARDYSINWQDCSTNDKYNAQCATIDTPIDHDDPSIGTFGLYVKKVWNKSNENALKSRHVLFNAGGPAIASASSGTSGIEASADLLYKLVPNDYILVGVDPRGSGESGLKVTCNTSDSGPRNDFPDVPPKLDETTTPLFRTQLQNYYDAEREYMQSCVDNTPHIAYLGTYFSADDMVYVFDKLVEASNTPVDLFAESYGSFLGLGMAVKHPNRVGKFLLNGIMSPSVRANTDTLDAIPSYLTSTDSVFDKMVESCQQTEECPFQGITKEYIDALTAMAYDNNDPVINSIYSTRTSAVEDIYSALYVPPTWGTAFSRIKQAASLLPSPYGPKSDISSSRGDAIKAINCADVQIEDFTVDDAINAMKDTYNEVTQRFYSQYLYQSGFTCQLYPNGTFDQPRLTDFSGIDFANKFLLVANVYDPILPLEQAHQFQDLVGKKNAGLLTIKNGYGHTATPGIAIPDTMGCMEKHSMGFFNGKKPKDCSCTVNEEHYVNVYD